MRARASSTPPVRSRSMSCPGAGSPSLKRPPAGGGSTPEPHTYGLRSNVKVRAWARGRIPRSPCSAFSCAGHGCLPIVPVGGSELALEQLPGRGFWQWLVAHRGPGVWTRTASPRARAPCARSRKYSAAERPDAGLARDDIADQERSSRDGCRGRRGGHPAESTHPSAGGAEH